jgi:hypothetical protein
MTASVMAVVVKGSNVRVLLTTKPDSRKRIFGCNETLPVMLDPRSSANYMSKRNK